MSDSKFASHAEAKRAGWFSRRHQTAGPHRDARDQRAKQEEEKAQRELGGSRILTYRMLTQALLTQ